MFQIRVKLSDPWKAYSLCWALMIFTGCSGCEESVIVSYPAISAQPEALNFGQVPLESSISKDLIITNNGLAELRLSTVELPVDDLSFSIRSIPGRIDAKDKKSMSVAFSPQAVGSFSSTITITSNAMENPILNVLVTGIGVPKISCGTCDMPPASRCLSDNDLLVYDGIGVCASNECRYASRVIICEGQCANGQCVGNRVPTVDLTLLPARPFTTDNLLANAVARDDDGDPLTLTYKWFKNQQAISETGASIVASQTSKNEEWMVTVTANDGQIDGPRKTARVVVVNSPPIIASAKIFPTAGGAQTVFSCLPGRTADADMDTVSFETQWYVNGMATTTSSVVDGQFFGSGDQLACELKPYDGEAFGFTVRSSTVTVSNLPPSVQSASLAPSSITTLVDVSVIPTGWNDPDGDPENYDFEWYVNGAIVNGAGMAMLGHQNYQRGDRVYARVTPNDGRLIGPSILSRTATVQNSPPSLATASITPGVTNELTTLSCVPSGWYDADNDIQMFDVSWRVNNGTPTTSSNLDGNGFDRGDRVQCGATPYDAFDVGTLVWSPTITIGNAPPNLLGAEITPASGDATTLFTCRGLGFSDPDGDAPGYQYRWYINGTSSSTLAQISAPLFGSNDVLSCDVYPDDGNGGVGSPRRSGDVTIGNTAPSAPTATVTPSNPASAIDATCSVLIPSIDVDNDPVTYSYTWSDGISTIGGPVLPASQTDVGQTWICTITPNDGVIDGPPANASVTIESNCWPDGTTDYLWARFSSPGLSNGLAAENYCASLDMCGFTDWRVPSVLELRSIVQSCSPTEELGSCPIGSSCTRSSCYQPSCNGCAVGLGPSGGGCYLNTNLISECTSPYSSSTPDDDNSSNIWSLDYGDGAINSTPLTNPQTVRCVRFPHRSCREILLAGVDRGNGVYSIDTDGDGGRPPFNVYCDMTTDGGGWTAIIAPADQSQAYLERFHLVTNTMTTYSVDPIKGATFGTTVPDVNAWLDRPYRAMVAFSYDEVRVTYSGTYDDPSGGLGQLFIGTSNSSSDYANIISLADTSGSNLAGHTLSVGGTTVFYLDSQAVLNRTDLISVPGSSFLQISMNGYLSNFGYTRRYIRQLWVR